MRFGWTAYIVPLLFVASPALLLLGEPAEIAGAVTTATMGVWLGSIGMVGYFVRRVPIPMRVLFMVAGVLALIPSGAFPLAIYTDFVGVIGGALLVGWELWAGRATAAASTGVS